jgi:FkbM family methyltransferase
MYSQNNEEEIILTYFRDSPSGKFIDIGGFHPTQLSNTRCLVERGWSGVYVEPSPVCMPAFTEAYSNNSNITLIQKAITSNSGVAKFFESNGDAVGTLSESHRRLWSTAINFTETEVETLAMSEFLEDYFEGTDFMSIDVEGTNLELFNLLPDSILSRIKMLCIEHEGNYEYMIDRCKKFGFKSLLWNAENIIFAK